MKKNLRLLICYCVLFLLGHTDGKPIIWNVQSHSKPLMVTSPAYGQITKEFFCLTDGNELEKLSHIDVVAHELVQGIIDVKSGARASLGIALCSERRVLAELFATSLVCMHPWFHKPTSYRR